MDFPNCADGNLENSGVHFYHDAGEMLTDAAGKISKVMGDIERRHFAERNQEVQS